MKENELNVCILNYGSGNVKSVYNLVKTLTNAVKISNKIKDIVDASHIILPGVGAFGSAMEKINKNLPLAILENEVLIKNKPFLGICVGMQVLADIGNEYGKHKGLGWIKGSVDLLEISKHPLPHIGWNNILLKRDNKLYSNLSFGEDFYFVHSYVFNCSNSENIIANVKYEIEFPVMIQKRNIFGVQFHPEKSQIAGKALIHNFLKIK